MNEFQERMFEQIEEAKANIRKLKRAAPYMYHEYGELNAAKQNLEQARIRYAKAKEAWAKLGN